MSVSSIQTDRIRLRPLRNEDAQGLFELWNAPEVREFLWDDQPVSMEAVHEQIERSQRSFAERGFGVYTLAELRAPSVLVGFAGLRPFGAAGEVEILYALARDCWGRGLATEAAWAILRFGFEQAGLEEIFAGADLPNAASFQLMERLGMGFARDELVGELPVRYHRLLRHEFQPAPGRYELLPPGGD